jgi:hypothetical protein
MKATYRKDSGVWRKSAYVWKKIGGFWVRQFPWFNNLGDWLECWEASPTAPITVFIVDSGGFTVSVPGINQPEGTVSFNGATASYSTALVVKVRVIHYITGVVNEVEYYNDNYVSGTDIGYMSHVVFGPPIPSAGYIIRLEFNEAM